MPLLVEKFRVNLARRFKPARSAQILKLCLDERRLRRTPVNAFVDLLVP